MKRIQIIYTQLRGMCLIKFLVCAHAAVGCVLPPSVRLVRAAANQLPAALIKNLDKKTSFLFLLFFFFLILVVVAYPLLFLR